ncbi:MAG: putative metal-dependent hydrolase [Porticoccaceae bacterium]
MGAAIVISMVSNVSYGETTISFQLSFTERKTLEISVLPDKSVFVKAPIGTDMGAIELKVKKRARWIKKQIRYFEQFDPRTPTRKYVAGESHLYLGKKYRLKVEVHNSARVRLKGGYFIVQCKKNDPDVVRSTLEDWYREKAKIYLTNIFEECWKRFRAKENTKPKLRLLKLRKRWGSLSKSGTLSLNVELIKAPKECIEYVVVHELCHLVHHNHGSNFYDLLEQSLPDWANRKHKLETSVL